MCEVADERAIARLCSKRGNPRVAAVYDVAAGQQPAAAVPIDAWLTTLREVPEVALEAVEADPGAYVVWYHHDGDELRAADESDISASTTFDATRANIERKIGHEAWTLRPVPIEATPFEGVRSGGD